VTDSKTRDLVRRLANNRCEYCLLRQEQSDLTHHTEHIVAKQHGGSDEPANLALACHRCNLRKGPNLTGIDSFTKEVVPLFTRVGTNGRITFASAVCGSRD
jgi:5-methylcytosine-specific restriction endonuclease McrA